MTAMLSPKIRQTRRARSKSMVMGEVSRGSCRPASPSLQEGALKAGWLKKQRSIMKNWQLRWFVLRSDQLYFYKDEEETKPQVTCCLFLFIHRLTATRVIPST
ncbi:rho GTPase-activating protein 22 isoform X6 [Paralichthys olivaceus]|uniref:rho GTPase-activating protein 22 isoform X6 n=1 Tax=Paralichthys olivaceus TaxID=8255 RepID=UPI0037510EC5